MLTGHFSAGRAAGRSLNLPARQGGVVLMIALIILVALTMGGLALVRSVGTTNIIAGNLAFQQSATHASQAGAEDAIASFLEANIRETFQNDDFTKAYSASTPAAVWNAIGDLGGNPASWDTYWASVIDPAPAPIPVAARTCSRDVSRSGVGRSCTLPTDGAGNTVSYTIQRLCQIAGDPVLPATGCASGAQQSSLVGGSLAAGSVALVMIPQYYYRITIRTVGPRNTVSYVQTLVAK
jgi:type IV pilus assembly protein PilX